MLSLEKFDLFRMPDYGPSVAILLPNRELLSLSFSDFFPGPKCTGTDIIRVFREEAASQFDLSILLVQSMLSEAVVDSSVHISISPDASPDVPKGSVIDFAASVIGLNW